MADISEWSPVDELNNQAPPAGFPEFMAPSALNNGARAMMGAVRRWYDTVTAQLASLTTSLAGYLPLTGGVVSGDLQVNGPGGLWISDVHLLGDTRLTVSSEVYAYGPQTGFFWGDNNQTSPNWGWYANGGTAYLWQNATGNVLTVNPAGDLTAGSLDAAYYLLSGVNFATRSPDNAVVIYDSSGSLALALYGTENFYRAGTHRWQNEAGAETATLNSTGTLTLLSGLSAPAVSASTITASGAVSAGTITASGNVNAVNVVASGNVSAGTITASGAMSVATVTASGAVSAGTLISTGNVNAVNVVASGNVNAVNVTAAGTVATVDLNAAGTVNTVNLAATNAVTAVAVTATSQINAATVTASGTVNAATVAATGTVSGNLLTGNSVHSNNAVNATTGYSLRNLPFASMDVGAANTVLYDPSSAANITMYGAAGGANYYDQNTHNFRNRGGGTQYAIFSAGGTFNALGGVWGTISEAGLKEDITPYVRGLDAVLALNPVSFVYRAGVPFADEARTVRYGLLADAVAPVMPETVGEAEFEIDGALRTVQTLQLGPLTFVLLNAVKELAARIEALEGEP